MPRPIVRIERRGSLAAITTTPTSTAGCLSATTSASLSGTALRSDESVLAAWSLPMHVATASIGHVGGVKLLPGGAGRFCRSTYVGTESRHVRRPDCAGCSRRESMRTAWVAGSQEIEGRLQTYRTGRAPAEPPSLQVVRQRR